jgi:hypothetical protein
VKLRTHSGAVKLDVRITGRNAQEEPQLTEPPDADPHVRWCGRGVAGITRYPLSRFAQIRVQVPNPLRRRRVLGRGGNGTVGRER